MCITAHHHLMLTPDAKYIFSKSNELWNPGHLSNLKYSCFDVCPEISGFQGIFRILMTVDCFTWHQPFYRVVMVVIMCGKKGRKNLAGFVRQVYCSSFRENLAFQHRTPPPQYKGSTLTHSFDPELLREGGGGLLIQSLWRQHWIFTGSGQLPPCLRSGDNDYDDPGH